MGLGFTNNNSDDVHTVLYPRRDRPDEPKNADVGKWIKAIVGILGALVMLGGIVWGTATLFAGMASDDDLDTLEDRVELVEKNDIKQTVILEQIKEALEKIDNKLDKALE